MRLKVSGQAPNISFRDIAGNEHWVDRRNIQLANIGKKTLVSFYREASCPFCNYRIYKLHKEMSELKQKKFRVINIYASTKEEVTRYFSRQAESMIMVADPKQELYSVYGIETASTLSRAKAILGRLTPFIKGNLLQASVKGEKPKDSGILPADFLINSDGFIVEAYYGRDIGDHISMDRLKSFANNY